MNIKKTEEENKNNITEKTNKKENSKIKIEILNGSGNSSSITKLSSSLKNEGYTISKTGKTNATSKTSIIKKGKTSDEIINSIKEIIGTGIITSSNSNSSSTNVTIILGKDYK